MKKVDMIEQIENILSELKAIQAKLPELRDLFWLKIDRYNEADQQRGVVFDEKFEQQRDKLFRVIDSFSFFIEKSFAPSAEEIAKEKALQKLRAEFHGFDDWNEEAKKALLEREMNDLLRTRNKTQREENIVDSTKKKITRVTLTKLLVTFPNGKIINEKYASITLSETIKQIGPEQVAALNILFENLPLVTKDATILTRPQYIENGYFVNSHSSTNVKKRQLEEISLRLNLNLKIEIAER